MNKVKAITIHPTRLTPEFATANPRQYISPRLHRFIGSNRALSVGTFNHIVDPVTQTVERVNYGEAFFESQPLIVGGRFATWGEGTSLIFIPLFRLLVRIRVKAT